MAGKDGLAGQGALHHIEDIGRLLLDARSDLATIRNEMSVGAGAASAGMGVASVSQATEGRLEQTIERVERELREKAELVLNAVNQGTVATQPRDRPASSATQAQAASGFDFSHHSAPPMRRSLGGSGLPPMASGQPSTTRGAVRKTNARISSAREKKDAASLTAQRRRAHRLAAPASTLTHHDGAETVVTEAELSKGMLSLLNQHRIPEGTDLTAAFDYGSPAVTLQRSSLAPHPSRTRLHIGTRVAVRGARNEWVPATVSSARGRGEDTVYDVALIDSDHPAAANVVTTRVPREHLRVPKRQSAPAGVSLSTLKYVYLDSTFYRYISYESSSPFDSLPLTSLTRTGTMCAPLRRSRSTPWAPRRRSCTRRSAGRGAPSMVALRRRERARSTLAGWRHRAQ